MEAAKIWFITLLATVTYGVAQDLVTTRVSLEYFTLGHADLFGTSRQPYLRSVGASSRHGGSAYR